MTRESERRAGWYDDESDAALLRYWDGAKWSPHTVPKPAGAGIDDVAGHTVRLRAPDEHTTVPVPPGHDGPAASASWIARAVDLARRALGGRRSRLVRERTSPRTHPAG